MKRPSFQFYPADWRKDPALSSCSMAARGLWIELMCIAHESDEYGHLSVNGRPMNAMQIARMVGESQFAVTKLLDELEQAGVFSRRDTDACIYSRRMVADERIRLIRSSCGRLGGNPNLLNQKDNQKDNQATKLPDKQPDKQSPTPSSSSSSSSSIPPNPPRGAGPDGFAEFWSAYPKKVGKPAALRAFRAAGVNGHLPEVVADVRRRSASEDWRKAGGQFVPNPATYLNQRRWEDEQPLSDDPFQGAI